MDSEKSDRSVRLVASDGDAGANPEDRTQECHAGAAKLDDGWSMAERDQTLERAASEAGDRGGLIVGVDGERGLPAPRCGVTAFVSGEAGTKLEKNEGEPSYTLTSVQGEGAEAQMPVKSKA
jgi:hypothetical protein